MNRKQYIAYINEEFEGNLIPKGEWTWLAEIAYQIVLLRKGLGK